MEIFGLALTLRELVMLMAFIFSAGGGYYSLKSGLNTLLERSDKADASREELKKEIRALELQVEAKISNVEISLSNKIADSDRRITQGEIGAARIDERLIGLQSTLTQVHDMVKVLVK
jgi:hypothetical protein